MTRFTFKLQAVLNIKKQKEKNLENELAKALQKLEAENRKLYQIQEERNCCARQLDVACKKGTTVNRLREFNAYMKFLHDRFVVQKSNVKTARENADKYREMLVKAVQEREILEKLKERQYEDYWQAVKKDEQKFSDEIAAYKYYISMAGEKDAHTDK